MEITANELLRSEKKYHSMSKKHNPYGDGLASERIHNFMTKINE